jgi:hypothetical protein
VEDEDTRSATEFEAPTGTSGTIYLRHKAPVRAGFTDISWMAVLLHVRNYGIIGTTKASENLYSDRDCAISLKNALGSQVL